MNGDFSELIKYLDGKFGKVDERFNQVDERFKEVDERFNQVDERFKEVDERFDRLFSVFATKEDLERAIQGLSTKEDFNNLLAAVDAYTKKADTYFQEMIMLSHKVDRNEKWILQLAQKLGVKLQY